MFDSEIEKLSDDELDLEIVRVEKGLSKMASMEGLFLLHRLSYAVKNRSSMPKSKDAKR